ncbi:RNA polymerase sigma factor sigE [Spatholobus suberectus]|nr:RNA polymerase sigma factor sigE [Spatholobus suberectus]
MGVVTVSSSAARTPLGLNTNFCSHHLKRPLTVAFKGDKHNDSALVATQEKIPVPVETAKAQKKRIGKTSKLAKRERVVFAEESSPSSLDVDYNEAAAMLENIYKLSPASDTGNAECIDGKVKRVSRRGKKVVDESKEKELNSDSVVRNQNKRAKRLNLDQRISLKKNNSGDVVIPTRKKRHVKNRIEKIEELIREYSVSTDFVSMDWKKTRIPPVLSSSEHAWLFKLMQPMKALLRVKEDLQKELARESADGELADATDMSIAQVKKAIEVGQAARNKLIKVI